jgi:hypothetical protein
MAHSRPVPGCAEMAASACEKITHTTEIAMLHLSDGLSEASGPVLDDNSLQNKLPVSFEVRPTAR